MTCTISRRQGCGPCSLIAACLRTLMGKPRRPVAGGDAVPPPQGGGTGTPSPNRGCRATRRSEIAWRGTCVVAGVLDRTHTVVYGRNMAKETISVRAERNLIDRLDRLAARTGETRSELAERAIAVGLDAIEETADLLGTRIGGATLGVLLKSPEFLRAMCEGLSEAEIQAKAGRASRLVKGGRAKGGQRGA